MKISVVIPAHNEEEYIGYCIDAVKDNGGEAIHEIVVIDNASADRTGEIARERGAKVIREDRKGTGFARQRGLEEATGDFIAFLDADTRLPHGWLDKFSRMLRKHPDLVSLSGPYRYYDGSWHERLAMNSLWYLSAPLMYRLVGYMILGGNFIASKKALHAIGGFDTSIKFFGDDTDTARRLSAQGKVKFHMGFHMPSSSRRLRAQGILRTNFLYAMNFLWPIIFHKPFTDGHSDATYRTARISPKAKSAIVTAFFGALGICGIFFHGYGHASPLLVVFYAVIVINTYYSIALFSRLVPDNDRKQNIVDAVLVATYAVLAFSFASPLAFTLAVTALFAVATLKYVLLMNILDHPMLLRRKIVIDSLGILLGLLASLGVFFGYKEASLLLLASIFFIANVILLFIKPMYRADE
jgi:glycosyltransferase involved in cell wall biosynthesis